MNSGEMLEKVFACKRIEAKKNCDPVRMGFQFVMETNTNLLIYESKKKFAIVNKDVTTFYDKRLNN